MIQLKDQTDSSICQDCSAREAIAVGRVNAERSLSYLLASDDIVDQQACQTNLRLRDHTDASHRGINWNFEQLTEFICRDCYSAIVEPIAVTNGSLGLFGSKNDRLLNSSNRNDESLVANTSHQSIQHGQRQRQAERDCRAFALLAVDINGTIQGFNVLLHYIHADASPRDFGELLCR